ncbi:hypothetical protein Prudu_011234 [Prunus dulcis]|uniref:Uncharacterized protein n=1 Tax=Prunus dulcis TaxID=3755 RepID=A0A4Y1RAU5_PRUDU|nr:hypothetical protein Prudu_011234 [Prunus dulcis]
MDHVLLKEDGGKDLLSPDTVPLNCDTPILDSKAEDQKAATQCLEKPSPPPNDIFGRKVDEPKDKSSIAIV